MSHQVLDRLDAVQAASGYVESGADLTIAIPWRHLVSLEFVIDAFGCVVANIEYSQNQPEENIMSTYATFRTLTGPQEQDLADTFQQMAAQLSDSGESAQVQFRILDGDERRYYCLSLDRYGCKASSDRAEEPALEVVTRSETWRQIAAGSLSPLDAFIQGKMRIRGDVELGKRLLRQLAGSEGQVDICC
jgi:putative sterol carrier protein